MELRDTQGFDRLVQDIAGLMLTTGQVVDTGHWQSLTSVPQTRTIEIVGVTVKYMIPADPAMLREDIRPNLPWAELHFAERVGGEPTNPGKTYHLWPYFRGNVPKHQNPEDGDRFSHTYMERMWTDEYMGIRYRYGNLSDVVKLLHDMPTTRQAYLPIWFPEDTGAHAGERVPCTLGYHLMMRGGRLHIMYPIRSCDFIRHFRDDVYLAARLVQWILDELRALDGDVWNDVRPGTLTMHMHSLHVFEPERPILRTIAYGPGSSHTEEHYGAAV